MTVKEAREHAKEILTPRRFNHVENVAKNAAALARRFEVDVEKARLAAWLHDITKEKSRHQLLQLMEQDDIIAQSTKGRPFAVWHGPCGAIYAKDTLGVTDPEVLNAIACHVTGKADMSTLDKILYVADSTSPERDYPGVETIRKLAETDLDQAVIAALKNMLDYLKRQGKDAEIDPQSVAALRFLEQQQNTGKDANGRPLL